MSKPSPRKSHAQHWYLPSTRFTLPLGVLSFSVFIILLTYALQLILHPVLQHVFGLPFLVIILALYLSGERLPGRAVNLRSNMPTSPTPRYVLATTTGQSAGVRRRTRPPALVCLVLELLQPSDNLVDSQRELVVVSIGRDVSNRLA